MPDLLVIDGSHGEGGGQVLRSSLTLAALTGRHVRIESIRRNRSKPGLAAQHLTAVRAAAGMCGAEVGGDEIGSQELDFAPGGSVRAGEYLFDVSEAREGGSAGSTSLVLQTILLPLSAAAGDSTVVLRGGTHVPWSPSIDYLADVWLPMLRRIGFDAEIELVRAGWYPAGQGEVQAFIQGRGDGWRSGLRPLSLDARGRLLQAGGRARAANLPAHVAQRMADRARRILAHAGVEARIGTERVRSASPGASLLLVAEYEECRAGFQALGRPGKPAETVAEEAAAAFLDHHRSAAAVEEHLADQLVLPLAVAAGESVLSVSRVTSHLLTVAWVVEQFGLADVTVEGRPGEPGTVRVAGRRLSDQVTNS